MVKPNVQVKKIRRLEICVLSEFIEVEHSSPIRDAKMFFGGLYLKSFYRTLGLNYPDLCFCDILAFFEKIFCGYFLE